MTLVPPRQRRHRTIFKELAMDLSKMSLTELRALKEQVDLEMKKREYEEVAKAREQIIAIAQSVGIPLKELIASQARTKAGRSGMYYRHPSNTDLHWSGRGRQPKWVKEWIASGQSLEALRAQV
jgi:DNA-binding protein H-NS